MHRRRERKKLHILDQNEWGGDLEVRLLAIGISKEIVVITGFGDTFTSARRFPCHPLPVPKMRGGIFIFIWPKTRVDQMLLQVKCGPHPSHP